MRRVVGTGVLVLSLVAASCAGDSPNAPAAPSVDAPSSPGASAGAASVEGTFDVGGHELYIRCTGSGSPTVVYLHGYIFDPSGGGSQNAGEIPGLLEEQHQVCVYDRANVGQSDAVEGPLTGSSSVDDLEALLEEAGVRDRTFSWGPRSVVCSPTRMPPPTRRMSSAWCSSTRTCRGSMMAPSIGRRRPSNWTRRQPPARRPGSKARNPISRSPSSAWRSPRAASAPVRRPTPSWKDRESVEAQQRFLDRPFPDGELVIVDTPHYMEPGVARSHRRRRSRPSPTAREPMFAHVDGLALAEVLADVEQDRSGKARVRLIAGCGLRSSSQPRRSRCSHRSFLARQFLAIPTASSMDVALSIE